MEISKRLIECSKLVSLGGALADIGTDHAYLPIYLLLEKKIERAIACDVNKGPLERAYENINSYGLKDKIELRQGNGLDKLKVGEVSSIAIAGMGGMLILEILKDNLEIAKSARELILQPQLDAASIRQGLHSLGFKIDEEKMIVDKNKYYNIIRAVNGSEKYENQLFYTYGKKLIEKKDPVLLKYLTESLKKNELIENQLNNNKTKSATLRLVEIKNNIKDIKEVIKWLQQ